MIPIQATKERYESAVAEAPSLRGTPFVQLLLSGNPYDAGRSPGGHEARLPIEDLADEYGLLQGIAQGLNEQVAYLDSFAEARSLTIEDVVSDLRKDSILVQAPIVTAKKIRQSYRDQGIAEEAVDMLTERGVLPLTYLSPAFPIVNTLVAAVLWGGTKSYYKEGRPYVQVGNESVGMLHECGKQLGIFRGLQRKNHFQITGGEFPRLLDCIPGLLKYGVKAKRNTKAHAKSLLPWYLSNMLLDKHEGITKQVVRKICRDQASIFIMSKREYISSARYSMRTIGRETEEKANELWTQVYTIFRKGFPGMIRSNQIKPNVKQNKYGLWEGIISLDSNQVFHLAFHLAQEGIFMSQ